MAKRPKKLTKEKRMAEQSYLIATAIGANECAKAGRSLGEKVFWRLTRDEMVKKAQALGYEESFALIGEPEVLQITMPGDLFVKFHERDIELMRECVAKWDADHE